MGTRERGWVGWVRFGLPGMILGLGLAWALGGREPSARAQGSTPPGRGVERGRTGPPTATPSGGESEGTANGTIAFTNPAPGGGQLLYLVDTKTKAFVVYRVDPSNPKGTVKLEAARQYQWDLKLNEYNNTEPGVAAIESTVRGAGPTTR